MPPKVGGGEMESRENQGTDTRSGIPSDENVPLWEPLFFPSFFTDSLPSPQLPGTRSIWRAGLSFDFVSLLLVF